MRDIVDVHYPAAEKVRVVLDNLSTHNPGLPSGPGRHHKGGRPETVFFSVPGI